MARLAYIYKNPTFAGCSNDGISDKYDQVLIVTANEQSDEPNAVRIVRRGLGSRVIFHAEPVNSPSGTVGAMAGGSFINLDGVVASYLYPEYPELADFYGAIALHDRYETPAEYAHYSN
jgi:hypothetical protein